MQNDPNRQLDINQDLDELRFMVKIIKDDLTNLPVCNLEMFKKTVHNLYNRVISGKKSDMTYFEFFVQHGLLRLLKDILMNGNFFKKRSVVIEGLKVVSMLVYNLRMEIYILSTKELMDIIMMPYDFKDYDIVSYYVNIIKSLINHAKDNSLIIFFNERHYFFPLLYRIIDFYNHPEGLVRTTVQNCVIGFLGTEDKPLQRYLASVPFVNYYCANTLYIKDYLSDLIIVSGRRNCDPAKIRNKLETFTDNVYYLGDLFSSKLPLIAKINFEVYVRFLLIKFLNYLVRSSLKKPAISRICLHVLGLFMTVLGGEEQVNLLSFLLLAPKFTKGFFENIERKINSPFFHSKTWIETPLFDYQDETCKQIFLDVIDGSYDPHNGQINIVSKRKTPETNKKLLSVFGLSDNQDDYTGDNEEEKEEEEDESPTKGLSEIKVDLLEGDDTFMTEKRLGKELAAIKELKYGDETYSKFLQDLVRDSEDLLVNAIKPEMELILSNFVGNQEKKDSKEINILDADSEEEQEEIVYVDNPFRQIFIALLKSNNNNHGVVNCMLVDKLIKCMQKNTLLKTLLLETKVPNIIRKTQSIKHRDFIDFFLYETSTAYFNNPEVKSIGQKYVIFMMHKLIDFKRDNGMGEFDNYFLEDITAQYQFSLHTSIVNLDDIQTIDSVINILPYLINYKRPSFLTLNKKQISLMLIKEGSVMDPQFEELMNKRNQKGTESENKSAKRERLQAIAKLQDLSDNIVFDSLKKIVILKELRYTLIPHPEGIPRKLSEFETDLSSQIMNFQNNYLSSFWEVGKVYEIKGIKKYRCKIALGAPKKKIPACILDDRMNFVIAEEVSKGFKILVREKLNKMAFDWIGQDKYIKCRKRTKNSGIELRFKSREYANLMFKMLNETSDKARIIEGKFIQGLLQKLLTDAIFPNLVKDIQDEEELEQKKLEESAVTNATDFPNPFDDSGVMKEGGSEDSGDSQGEGEFENENRSQYFEVSENPFDDSQEGN